jgi:hypothetical protein
MFQIVEMAENHREFEFPGGHLQNESGSPFFDMLGALGIPGLNSPRTNRCILLADFDDGRTPRWDGFARGG